MLLPIQNHNALIKSRIHDASYPEIIKKLKPTPIYNLYWYFAAERHEILMRRYENKAKPWTSDAILQQYKFTNTYRVTDKTTQFLIKNVITRDDASPKDTLFRVLLFKIFNKIDTWKILTKEFKEISYDTFDINAYDAVLTRAMLNGTKIYSAAYIMPTGGKNTPYTKKHQLHLHLIKHIISNDTQKKIQDCRNLESCFKILKQFPTIGTFLAYQYAIDINYSSMINFSENEYVAAGPGARNGISKCFQNRDKYTDEDIIRIMKDIQEEEFTRIHGEFGYLWGRRLHLIDCQNVFCEIDKYSRISHPEIHGESKRNRIKQNFTQTSPRIELSFPPKWNLILR